MIHTTERTMGLWDSRLFFLDRHPACLFFRVRLIILQLTFLLVLSIICFCCHSGHGSLMSTANSGHGSLMSTANSGHGSLISTANSGHSSLMPKVQ